MFLVLVSFPYPWILKLGPISKVGLELDGLYGPFQHKSFYGSVMLAPKLTGQVKKKLFSIFSFAKIYRSKHQKLYQLSLTNAPL